MKAIKHGKRVIWFIGLGAVQNWWETDMCMMLSRHTKHEYTRWRSAPMKVIRLRKVMIERFMLETSRPTDTLAMLDIDHNHSSNIINCLVEPDEYGVHTSLTFKRAASMPLASVMDYPKGFEHGEAAKHVGEIHAGEILECDRGGHAAIAVQRRVFQAILDLGYTIEQFYQYIGQRDCDQHFAQLCSEAGFKHYVNTGIISPHLRNEPQYVGVPEWDAYEKGKGLGGWIIDA